MKETSYRKKVFENVALFFGPVAIPSSPFYHETLLRLLLFSFFLISFFPVLRWGGTGNWTNFDTPSFLAILRDPAGDPQSSWSIGRRLAGAKQYRLFTNTSWPAGVSKRLGLEAACLRALPIFVFSHKCILSFPSLSKNDRASSSHRSRKAMMCAKPFESEIITFKEGVLSVW